MGRICNQALHIINLLWIFDLHSMIFGHSQDTLIRVHKKEIKHLRNLWVESMIVEL